MKKTSLTKRLSVLVSPGFNVDFDESFMHKVKPLFDQTDQILFSGENPFVAELCSNFFEKLGYNARHEVCLQGEFNMHFDLSNWVKIKSVKELDESSLPVIGCFTFDPDLNCEVLHDMKAYVDSNRTQNVVCLGNVASAQTFFLREFNFKFGKVSDEDISHMILQVLEEFPNTKIIGISNLLRFTSSFCWRDSFLKELDVKGVLL